MEVITKDMEEVQAYFEALERGMKYVDNVTANFRPAMNGEVYLTGGRRVQDIAYHYPHLAGLPGAKDYPVHCVAGQNAVSAVGHIAYAGRKLCADEAKKQTWEKSYLTFESGAWINVAKAGTPKRNSCLCCVLPCRKEIRRFHARRLFAAS